MEFNFRVFPVLSELKGFIERIWMFEANGRLPGKDRKLVVPNGRPMLLLPVKNGLESTMDNKKFICSQDQLFVVGICDQASIVDSLTDGPTASIGIEFSPHAFYRFFHVPAHELSNSGQLLTDILPATIARSVQSAIAQTSCPEQKVYLMQLFLLRFFMQKPEDSIFSWCIGQIEQSYGHLSIAALEKKTGYSSRWLHHKFIYNLGLSPKNFSSIIRFQHYYKALLTDTRPSVQNFHQQYYDQSHYIRDFKRFTGTTPARLHQVENKFGELFY